MNDTRDTFAGRPAVVELEDWYAIKRIGCRDPLRLEPSLVDAESWIEQHPHHLVKIHKIKKLLVFLE